MAKGWSRTKNHGGVNRPRWNSIVAALDFTQEEGRYVSVRPIGPVMSMAVHWIPIITKQGKRTSIPKYCLDYDREKDEFPDHIERCPYCEGQMRRQVLYYQNVIVRKLQDAEPANKPDPIKSERKARKIQGESHYMKDRESNSWTPVRVLEAGVTLAEKLRNITQLNKGRELNDPKYGMDISISYHAEVKNPQGRWDVQKDERTELTEEETAYLLYDMETVVPFVMESEQEANAEWIKLKQILADDSPYGGEQPAASPATEDKEDKDDDDDDDYSKLPWEDDDSETLDEPIKKKDKKNKDKKNKDKKKDKK